MITPRLVVALLAALLVSSATEARADDKDVCIDAHLAAQALKKRAALRDARRHLVVCAKESCPSPIVADCSQWLDQLDRELGSVVLSVRDAMGRDLRTARVLVDGEPFANDLDGRPSDVDPGEHTFRFEAPGMQPKAIRLVIRTGEKARAVAVDLEALPAAPSAAPSPRPSVSPSPAVWVLGGVAVASFAAFGYFGISGNAKRSMLRDSCAPNCDQADVDTVRRDYVVATVALGIGVVSLGAAVFLALARHRSPYSAFDPSSSQTFPSKM